MSKYHFSVSLYLFCFDINKDTIVLFKAVPVAVLSQWNADSASTPVLIRCNEAVNYSKCHTSQNGLWLKLATVVKVSLLSANNSNLVLVQLRGFLTVEKIQGPSCALLSATVSFSVVLQCFPLANIEQKSKVRRYLLN